MLCSLVVFWSFTPFPSALFVSMKGLNQQFGEVCKWIIFRKQRHCRPALQEKFLGPVIFSISNVICNKCYIIHLCSNNGTLQQKQKTKKTKKEQKTKQKKQQQQQKSLYK